MKNTPLTDINIQLGAKMVDFAGYNMPVYYSGITEEHLQVRNSVGVFDVSHMGEFILEGSQALDLIQLITSNDASTLEIGQAQYSCMPNLEGGIVDDLIVYRLDSEKYMLVVNASNIDKDWNWIQKNNTFGVKMTNMSDQMGLLAVQGPNATKALQSLTDVDLASIPYYHFRIGNFAGHENIIISATGYTGSGGFELYIPNDQLVDIWNKIMEAGKPYGILPIGLGARDTLRLEMGYCLYGNDIDDHTNPIEAGLGWITKFTKTFNGDVFAKEIKEQGVKKKLVGVKIEGRGIPRHGYHILDDTNDIIGHVTSGSKTPSVDYPIALAYIKTPFNKLGTQIQVQIREKNFPGEVVKLPFYHKN